jgi:F-type H+-transporting ATPase subunit b
MRTRKLQGRALLLAAGALVVGAVLAPTPAGAVEQIGDCVADLVEEELEARGLEPGTPEARAAIEEIEDDAYEECLDAPNPLLPDINEVIWAAIGFFVVYFFIWKFGFPAIKGSMNARAERIQGDLDAAAAQRSEADQILSDYRAQLADAKNESARIIEEARQAADSLKREQEARLQTELAEMRQRSQADIEAAKTQAIADLRNEVASLAVGAAEVIVQRNLDEASQVELVEAYINQVASQRS